MHNRLSFRFILLFSASLPGAMSDARWLAHYLAGESRTTSTAAESHVSPGGVRAQLNFS